jgi:hypothetical protein
LVFEKYHSVKDYYHGMLGVADGTHPYFSPHYPIDLGASSWISTMMPNLRMYLASEKYLSVRFCQNLKLPLVVLSVLLGLLHYAYKLTLVQFIAKSCNMT